MTHVVSLPNGYAISDERGRLDMDFVVEALGNVYWARGRPRESIERSWAHCLGVGVYAPGGAQVGFARVLTDYAVRAHLGDVFVLPEVRGLGLGVALVETVLRHPALVTVDHWTLQTSDAHGLYQRFGFRPGEADGRWMVLDRTPGR